ncbi:THAP domain-containing protein 6 isoform X2 [Pangasianodon hypophthalmus]|uniref:THAP domain-containing protein 6 isoform X2 n=1 Tax=Pangasianodon hypophthalmus TaxID=310915 RepID=UPI000EFF8C91|nr:THAP domain-containing protein 6 isoform X2 [Pangasianodon hypophthalmus]
MFPTDAKLRKIWETALRKEGFSATPHSVLCSQHFTEDAIDRTGQIVRLREGAVPSVFNFPAHLQKKPIKPRKTATSQKAAAPYEVVVVKADSNTNREKPETLVCDEHSYALDPSPNRVKDRLAQALANMERLQRQLRNAKDRERRCKTTLKSALDDLKERNLLTDELHQRLDLYSSL